MKVLAGTSPVAGAEISVAGDASSRTYPSSVDWLSLNDVVVAPVVTRVRTRSSSAGTGSVTDQLVDAAPGLATVAGSDGARWR